MLNLASYISAIVNKSIWREWSCNAMLFNGARATDSAGMCTPNSSHMLPVGEKPEYEVRLAASFLQTPRSEQTHPMKMKLKGKS
jgi:hypothetical protein